MQNKIIIGIVAFAIIVTGVSIVVSNNQPKTQTVLSKTVEISPEKTPTGEFKSVVAELKVIENNGITTATFPINKFKSKEVLDEIGKLVESKQVPQPDAGMMLLAVGMASGLNTDTVLPCGIKDPKSPWCINVKIDKPNDQVIVKLQKGLFEIKK